MKSPVPSLGQFNRALPGHFWRAPKSAYKSTLSDICTALKNAGFGDIVLIGDHQGAQRGLKAVAEELSRKWNGGPTRVHYIAEYYDRTAVGNYVKTTLGINETRGRFGDNYYNTSILMAVSPESARLQERVEAKQLTVNGIHLEPIENTIENGKKILQIQTDQTVEAIRKAIAAGQTHVGAGVAH